MGSHKSTKRTTKRHTTKKRTTKKRTNRLFRKSNTKKHRKTVGGLRDLQQSKADELRDLANDREVYREDAIERLQSFNDPDGIINTHDLIDKVKKAINISQIRNILEKTHLAR